MWCRHWHKFPDSKECFSNPWLVVLNLYLNVTFFMKKVRFESPNKFYIIQMNESECHSPRPFIARELQSSPPVLVPDCPRVLTYSYDTIQRYECSNSIPYPGVSRAQVTGFPEKDSYWKPSDDLNLSLLDASNHEPRQAVFSRSILKDSIQNKFQKNAVHSQQTPQPLPFSPVEMNNPPNVLVKDDNFFIKRDNLNKYNFNGIPIQTHLSRISLGKENDPPTKKHDLMKNVAGSPLSNLNAFTSPSTVSPSLYDECKCHHCIKKIDCMKIHQTLTRNEATVQNTYPKECLAQQCICSTHKIQNCSHCHISPLLQHNLCKTCDCHANESSSPIPQNAVDRKTWTIQKYEQNKLPKSTEIEKQNNISKEKREPTVADLFKIIKLQNEQLQLLQEKVDKFMLSRQNMQPTITCSTEHVALNAVDNNQGKISVGVMTSFEMIRTSTVINKEVVTQNEAQIQCNRSQISIKEVVSKPVHMNFLDGIVPKNDQCAKHIVEQEGASSGKQIENVCEEKTLNELSLYNVQVDNATTPLMSPEQTMYLDVRDYSDSEASSNDQSNVGWTYYNKVMTHVNGMLQDSEMPSSASAMYRNLRQQRVQMHIDTTNVSVTKRVKFGDDPLGLRQPHIYSAPTTDTSLKMNQLAAKYLKGAPPRAALRPPAPLAAAAPIDMSFATRNYMEKHRLLQGLPMPSKSPPAGEIPRFLDITALKQQPKFL